MPSRLQNRQFGESHLRYVRARSHFGLIDLPDLLGLLDLIDLLGLLGLLGLIDLPDLLGSIWPT